MLGYGKIHLIIDGDRSWIATARQNDDGTASVEYMWFLDSGAVQSQINVFKTGKNIGKANETTPFDQAVVEARAKANKRIMEGYKIESVVGDATTWELKTGAVSPLPMLAHEWSKHHHKMPDEVFIQPKLDGIRCICNAKTGKMFSRKGEQIMSAPHVEQYIKQLAGHAHDAIEWFDGELYNHDLEFQQITSIVRTQKGLHPDSNKIQYHIYDCILNQPAAYSRRLQHLFVTAQAGWMANSSLLNPLVFVDTIKGKKSDVANYHSRFVDLGYEGVMVRDPSSVYEDDKRSSKLLKVKMFLQDEFEVVDIEQEKSEDTLGAFLLKTKQGKLFSSRPAFSDAQRKEIWDNRATYQWSQWVATVKYQELSTDLIPRFNTTLGLRNTADV